jgi:UDPglucose--hexose-1-phosphate uridylyltransferase
LPELRQNIITGDWVVIAPERAKRPQDYIIPPSLKVSKPEDCPFCKESKAYKANHHLHIEGYKDVYVIQNKYPAFVENGHKEARSFYPEDGFYRAREANGDHEVVVVKDHTKNLMIMPKPLITELFTVIKDRYNFIKAEPGVASIMPIYNHGSEAGASIDHPHAQIFASGIVANTVGKELEGAERYFGINGVCVFCDIIKHERKEKVRIVYENKGFVAAAFFASRFPMETWIYPKEHASQFEQSSPETLEQLADAVSQVAVAMEKSIPRIPLNFWIHTLPVALEGSSYYHWHLEMVPRITNYGGYELGSGVVIDIMNPEDATEYLRK